MTRNTVIAIAILCITFLAFVKIITLTTLKKAEAVKGWTPLTQCLYMVNQYGHMDGTRQRALELCAEIEL